MEINNFLVEQEIGRYIENVSFKELTSLRIGGTASLLVYPQSVQKLGLLIKELNKQKINYFCIGNGTNLLVNDRDFDLVLISLKDIKEIKKVSKNEFLVSAGLNCASVANCLSNYCYEGCEFLSVIPGTIGGVIWMNAGAYKKEMVDVIKEVNYIDEFGNLKNYIVNPNDFSYRHSPFQHTKNTICSAIITATKTKYYDTIQTRIEKYLNVKKNTQPIGKNNAGSTFKNNGEIKSWEIIDKLGLRGYRIGDASISKKHANFFINEGNAKFKDMQKLLNETITLAKQKYNVDLECEWKILE